MGFADWAAIAMIGVSNVLLMALLRNKNFLHTFWTNFFALSSSGGIVCVLWHIVLWLHTWLVCGGKVDSVLVCLSSGGRILLMFSWRIWACRDGIVVFRNPIWVEFRRIVFWSSQLWLCSELWGLFWDVLHVLYQHILHQNHRQREWIELIMFCVSRGQGRLCFANSHVFWVISLVIHLQEAQLVANHACLWRF